MLYARMETVQPDSPNYQVDQLFLLIGTNPLPNYVTAKLLSRDPQTTTIWFVHSPGTTTERDALEQALRGEGYNHFQAIQVDESSSTDIYRQIRDRATGLSGSIGLNYTGGTKAMAVHAYRAFQEINYAQCSYLDARSLTMHVERSRGGGTELIPDVIDRVQVPLQKLLDLHGLSQLKRPMQREVMWEKVIYTLMDIHRDKASAQEWRRWCDDNLRRKDRPDKFLSTTKLNGISTECLPEQVQQALGESYPGLTFPMTFEQLAKQSPRGKADEDFAKWFDGTWMEQYVYLQLQPLLERSIIHDLAMTINPLLREHSDSNFELDVACMRGYQLFACSVTSSDTTWECKIKLLEALIRSEQLGGGESRVALICCIDNPQSIRDELSNPAHRARSRVFGRRDLPDLQAHLERWITEPNS